LKTKVAKTTSFVAQLATGNWQLHVAIVAMTNIQFLCPLAPLQPRLQLPRGSRVFPQHNTQIGVLAKPTIAAQIAAGKSPFSAIELRLKRDIYFRPKEAFEPVITVQWLLAIR